MTVSNDLSYVAKHFKAIRVNLKNNPYTVYIGRNRLEELAMLCELHGLKGKVLIVTNNNVGPLYGEKVVSGFKSRGHVTHLVEVSAGEEYKDLRCVSKLIDTFLQLKLERNDTIIALGGGVLGDTVGFAASIYLRGVPFVQCPTTLLSQVDAAVGGKTGVNHREGKNLIGTFYQPRLVFADASTLTSLPKREILAGLAEVIKYGIIRDKPLFWYIEQQLNTIKKFDIAADPEVWSFLIEKSCQNKVAVVEMDERERSLRETLNFGHTLGHAIEAAYGYTRFLHGEAVAIGMKAASFIAWKMDLLQESAYNRIVDLLTQLDFPLEISAAEIQKILHHLETDKKIRNGKVRFILPTNIGETETRDNVSPELVIEALHSVTSGRSVSR